MQCIFKELKSVHPSIICMSDNMGQARDPMANLCINYYLFHFLCCNTSHRLCIETLKGGRLFYFLSVYLLRSNVKQCNSLKATVNSSSNWGR